MTTTGPKYDRRLAATDLCRTYVPQIFERSIAGDSCRTIAAWLESEQVPTMRGGRWHEGSVRQVIRNATYAGRRIRRPAPGEKYGDTFQYCPEAAVIDMDTWRRANEAMNKREKRGPANPRTAATKPLLAKLRCLRCGSPMYRNLAPRASHYVYRCWGSGAQKRGCGNRVPLAQTELIVAAQIFQHQAVQDQEVGEGRQLG